MIYPKAHQNILSSWDELPRFHFPSKDTEIASCKEVEYDSSSQNEKFEIESLHSNHSTKAYATNENSANNEHGFQGILSYSDIYEESVASAKSVENLEQLKKPDHLPTLKEIFNLSSNQKVDAQKPMKFEVESEVQEEKTDISKELDEIIAPRKANPSKNDLSKRGDVVNKTILRAMKRYYSTEFDTSFNFSGLSDKEKFAKFKYQIRKFVTEQIKIVRGLSDKEVEDVIFFFGSMISHVHMRRGITISKLRTQVNFVHKCLYNYSHKKLSQLMSQEGFKYVLEDFVVNGGFEIVLNSEETMLKQQDAYKEAVDTLLLKCQE